jgi:polysaccharide chain length determinant protein (PEP-CTERM system associated)
MTDLRRDLLMRLAVLWRRRWAGLALVWIVCLIGWTVVLLLPSQFRSQALVYVDTDTLLGPLLKDLTVANDMQHQVPLIMRTLLSRPNLHKVAVATDLALDTQSPVDEVNLYERMESHAQITVQGANLLSISYTDANPVLARDVVQALLSVLVDNSNLQNRSEMDKALAFIEKQIATYEEKLRFIENRMADFKRLHGDVLVSSDSNLGARKDTLREAVSVAQGQVAELRSGIDLLNEQIRTVPQFLTVDNAPQVIVNDSRGDTARIADLQRTLDNLRLLYTDQHPDVIAAERQLDLMRDAKSGAPETDQPRFHSQLSNPVYEKLQMRLFEGEQQLGLARAHLAAAQAAQRQLDVMSAENPTIVAQYTDLSREYDVLKKQYDELLVRRESALMSQAVENTSQKIQFRVVEPPRIPAKPFGPPRLLLLAAVLGVALIGWPGLAFLMDHIALPVTSADDLARHSSLPLLGSVSKIPTRQDLAIQARWNLRFAGATLSLLLLFGGLFLITLHRSGLLGDHGVVESWIGENHVG